VFDASRWQSSSLCLGRRWLTVSARHGRRLMMIRTYPKKHKRKLPVRPGPTLCDPWSWLEFGVIGSKRLLFPLCVIEKRRSSVLRLSSSTGPARGERGVSESEVRRAVPQQARVGWRGTHCGPGWRVVLDSSLGRLTNERRPGHSNRSKVLSSTVHAGAGPTVTAYHPL